MLAAALAEAFDRGAIPARWTLEDPRRRPYLVFWTSDEGLLALGCRMEPDAADTVQITMPAGRTTLAVVQRAMPSGTGTALLYRCPSCGRPRRHLYPYALVGGRLVDWLGWQCQACAGLRWRLMPGGTCGFRGP